MHSVNSCVCLVNNQIGDFSSMTKSHFLFGYFTQFANSGNSHQCKFAYLPPTLFFNSSIESLCF